MIDSIKRESVRVRRSGIFIYRSVGRFVGSGVSLGVN